MLAVLGATSVIDPVHDSDGKEIIGKGTVAAGYQNFFICIEMFFAAICLRFAFGVSAYVDAHTGKSNDFNLLVQVAGIIVPPSTELIF